MPETAEHEQIIGLVLVGVDNAPATDLFDGQAKYLQSSTGFMLRLIGLDKPETKNTFGQQAVKQLPILKYQACA